MEVGQVTMMLSEEEGLKRGYDSLLRLLISSYGRFGRLGRRMGFLRCRFTVELMWDLNLLGTGFFRAIN